MQHNKLIGFITADCLNVFYGKFEYGTFFDSQFLSWERFDCNLYYLFYINDNKNV